jgi:inner membrane protein
MDSLTQIVLGAAVGEAVLGRKVGNRAMLYGAIAGTIPDLDVLASNFTDTTRALEMHRGFTHSIVFSVFFAPLFGWLVSRYDRFKSVKGWSWLFFWAFVTHPLLDAHTTWGTQLFWPLDLRLAFQSIFVIDPLYTLPFLVFFILAMLRKRTNPMRRFYNTLGLAVSSGYLMLTLVLKWIAFGQFEDALAQQQITYRQMDTRPAPLNTVLWNANVETDSAYLLGDYSFFDTQPIRFQRYPKQHQLWGGLEKNERAQRMIGISQGWYTLYQDGNQLYFNDLRFGLMSLEKGSQDFVFKYAVSRNAEGEVTFTEEPKDRQDARVILDALWGRMTGN